MVFKPGASADAYRYALLQAEEPCRLKPQNGSFVTALAVPQYHLDQYQAAVETLARSEQLRATPATGCFPDILAFRAMAQEHLAEKEQAPGQ